jgi:hypothetical protein
MKENPREEIRNPKNQIPVFKTGHGELGVVKVAWVMGWFCIFRTLRFGLAPSYLYDSFLNSIAIL